MAIMTVTNLNDSGPGSLRDAIAAAAPGSDTINFAVTGSIFDNVADTGDGSGIFMSLGSLSIARSAFLTTERCAAAASP